MFFSQLESLSELELRQLKLLREFIKDVDNACVAFSGGVDSSLVATIAQEQLGSKAIAVTGVSPSLAPYLLKQARLQATWIGIHHEECQTNEINEPNYFKNPENRCFACKKELHKHLNQIAKRFHNAQVLDGVNLDDLDDFRPGINASNQAGVISPLAELKIDKKSIRSISKSLGLPWWDKPAQPCLASRIPFGEEISSKRLEQIALAEEWIINQGFSKVRVRSQGLSARIELPANEIDSFLKNIERNQLIKYFLYLGFHSISLDLEGFISGKLTRDIKTD
ncbi:ATP-dependent sacrificial sulfur transferase LarE [Prochlorococcus sp. MIT 0916]|uniref:GMP synthase (Glutamine-hydrolyzing) n=1 Tax=Prochlorococcus marinus str. P0903-H212 TaxID=1622208 RepID=A0A0D5A390_PROMR|nr:GMP synthase (glutamine-hydrolyzing) [Prochlorococcus marinus str. P0903-H212]